MYKIMTPGPVQVPENVRLARSCSTTNADLDPVFFDEYKELCELISNLLHTKNETLILSGEGILGLEAACATMTEPGDRVLVLDNGIYGAGFADFVTMYGGNPVLRIRVLHMGYGEPQQRFQSPLFSEKLHRKRKYAVQKIKDRFAFQLLFFPEPLHEDFQHFLANPFRSPVNGGNHNKFQSVLDPPLLLQRQPVVRPDQPFQILLPQRPRGPVVRIRHIGRKLLPVSGVKVGEDLSDQRRRLPPDIPLPVQ